MPDTRTALAKHRRDELALLERLRHERLLPVPAEKPRRQAA